MESNRDDFNQKTKDLLAKRAGFRCSNPECRHITIGANTNPEKSTNIGVASHISAAAPGGPRYDSKLDSDERASIENGIWLCYGCSVLIDKDTDKYTTDILKDWKENAERKSMNEVNGIDNKDFYSDDYNDLFNSDFDEEEEWDKKSSIICDITSLLSACRRTMSWDNRSELKLYSWLDNHSEEEIVEQDSKELEIIRKSILEYLNLHLDMDEKLLEVPLENHVEEDNIYEYIRLHPILTAVEIANANRNTIQAIKVVLKHMWQIGKIIPVPSKNNHIDYFDNCKWMKNYESMD